MFGVIINALLDWMIDGAVESWKTACKFALQAGVTTEGQWSAVNGVIGHLGGVMAVIAIGFGAVGVAKRAWRKEFGNMVLVAAQTVFAWPLSMIVLWASVQLSNMATSLTSKVLSVDLSKGDQNLSLPDLSASTIKGAFSGPLLLLLMILLILSSASLIIAMAARNFLFLLAVCFVSMAWLVVSDRQFEQALRYGGWIAGIILYQPVCAVLISLTGQLMKDSGDTPLSFITAVVGMFLSGVMPWVLVGKIAHLIPGSVGIEAAASTNQATTQATVEVTEKAVSAAATVAQGLATGGATTIGGAGGAGGGAAGGFVPVVDRPGGPTGASTAANANATATASGANGAGGTGGAGGAGGAGRGSDGFGHDGQDHGLVGVNASGGAGVQPEVQPRPAVDGSSMPSVPVPSSGGVMDQGGGRDRDVNVKVDAEPQAPVNGANEPQAPVNVEAPSPAPVTVVVDGNGR
jgi:hypothetical protein